ncbi:MAG: hypothetical protein ACR2K2_13060 [Mycobacteriales bacterium]
MDQIGRLSLTLAALREQQGRAAQAAARGAVELLIAEQTRRTHASFQVLTVTLGVSRPTAGRPGLALTPEPPFGASVRPAAPAPARRPGRAR